jgi:hypothetical protein
MPDRSGPKSGKPHLQFDYITKGGGTKRRRGGRDGKEMFIIIYGRFIFCNNGIG